MLPLTCSLCCSTSALEFFHLSMTSLHRSSKGYSCSKKRKTITSGHSIFFIGIGINILLLLLANKYKHYLIVSHLNMSRPWSHKILIWSWNLRSIIWHESWSLEIFAKKAWKLKQESNWHLSKSWPVSLATPWIRLLVTDSEVKMTSAEVISEMCPAKSKMIV